MTGELKELLDEKAEAFVQYTVDVIYGRENSGLVCKLYGGFLSLLSYLYNGIVQTRYFFYRKRILRDQPLGCLVVVVGNLTVGGTGKTPIVEIFARTLRDRGRKVAILSRGYKSKKEPLYKRCLRWLTHTEAPPPRIVSDGKKVFLDSETAGDEPYMLARNLDGVVVLTDKNRVKAGHYAIKHFGADTLLLDDGFQHFPLRGRLNLLLIDKSNPFGNRQLLPRGVLREPIKHLKRASYIFLTKSDGKPNPELEKLIRKHKPDADLIECKHQAKYLSTVNGDKRLELSHLDGKRIGAFSGIATPESFEDMLRDNNADIVCNRRFLDHHKFTSRELENYFEDAVASKVEYVVTTEKDAVRIDPSFTPTLPLYYLRMEIEILSGADDFEEAVNRVCFPQTEYIEPEEEGRERED